MLNGTTGECRTGYYKPPTIFLVTGFEASGVLLRGHGKRIKHEASRKKTVMEGGRNGRDFTV